MMVVLILKGHLSGKSKDNPSTLGKFSEMDLSTQLVIQTTRHYFIFFIAMAVIEDKTSYSNHYSGYGS